MLALKGWETDERLAQAAIDMRTAADLYDQGTFGWCQYETDDRENNRRCAAGAINYVTGSFSGIHPFDHPSVTAVAAFKRVTGEHLVTYNDAEGRTVAEVQAKLREVADEIDKVVAANVTAS